MRYIAVNTAAPVMEIAVVSGDKEGYVKLEKTMASECLLPEIDRLLDQLSLNKSDFDAFVCVTGPGSFTGIRIGVNTVRALGYALNKSAFGVTYTRLMAYNINSGLALADGGNGVCYVAAYDGDNTVMEPQCIYKKDVPELTARFDKCVSDFCVGKSYEPSLTNLKKAAVFAIENKLGTEPLYIRKPQPERKEKDI